MGKPKGFLEYLRELPLDRPALERIRDWNEFHLHLDDAKLTTETKARAAGGVVAYSAICTHAGCEVAEWVPDKQLLFCPCHESTFDPADGAKVIDGPAVKILPALPLGLADGKLVVRKPFTAPITFETQ